MRWWERISGVSVAAALLAGCGHAPRPVAAGAEGRGVFEFVRPPASPESAEAKLEVREETAKEVWVAPRAIGKLADPVYPAVARGQGPVTMGVQVVVDTEGKVAEVRPSVRAWATPTPWTAEFRAAIEAAVAQWRFRPAEVRRFTMLTNAEGSYRSLVSSEKTEWVLEVVFSFQPAGADR